MRSTFQTIRALLWGVRLVFRFLSGRPMSGERKTDATFWRPATRALDPSGKALRWEMMRGASRAAWRLGVSYLALLWPLALLLSWSARALELSAPWYLSFSFLLWSHVLGVGGALATWLGFRLVREHGITLLTLELQENEEGESKLRPALRRVEGRREWRREKVLPLARAVSVIAGHSIPDRKADEWVSVPQGYRDGAAVSIRLPAHFTGADVNVQKRLVSSVSARLGVPGMNPAWLLEGSVPRVLLTAPPLPPETVSFSDARKWLESSEEYRPLLGVAGGVSPFYAEMIDDSPHIGLSAGPGAGKSTMAKALIAQALHWGWGVVVLDWKRSGAFDWLGGLEGVTYLHKIEDIHDMGIRLAEEVDQRKAFGMAGKAKVLVVRDEWNVTAPLLYDYYAVMRSTADAEDKKRMPLRSPALSGFAVLDFAGREYGLFDFAVAQKFSARIFNGNADIRECFGIKLLARYSAQTVKMLAPDVKPFPRKNNHVGRWVAVVGDEATVFQGVFLTNSEARSLAVSGKENPKFPLGRTQPTQHVEDREYLGDVLRPDATPPTPTVSPSADVNLPQRGSRLSELVEPLEHLGITHNVLRNAARSDEKGDPTFPSPVSGDQFKGYLYSQSAVLEWARRRHAANLVKKGSK